MKSLKFLFILLCIANSFWGCEPDDICEAGTPTTPRLFIEFYDNTSPSTKKIVTDLKVIADGEPNGIVFNTTTIDSLKYKFTGTEIKIPLKTNQDITSYSFILYDENEIASLINKDKIEIHYTHKDIFISRACGYKTNFKLDDNIPIKQQTAVQDPDRWIKEITIQEYNILNETQVHVKIFF
jgi:hypothetical protein